MNETRVMTCEDVASLAGLWALDALEPDDATAVGQHLGRCPEVHATFADLAPLGATLATAVEPAEPPAELRSSTLAAIAATPQVASSVGDATSATEPEPMEATQKPRGWRAWFGGRHLEAASFAAAGLAIVLVVAGIGSEMQRAADADGRLAVLRWAVTSASDPSSNVAVLAGSGSAEGASGFAVFPEDRPGYIVVGSLPAVPNGMTYQAWYIGDDEPTSAGLLARSDDGLGILTELEPILGTATIALTVEALPGANAPTDSPVVIGVLQEPTA